MISTAPVDNLLALVRQRIQDAIEYRKTVVEDSDAYRVIFSEADFLPGLIVDRYNDVLSVQVLTQAMDADAVRNAAVEEFRARFQPSGIVERVDQRVRELEKLPARSNSLLWGAKSDTIVNMNGVRFQFRGLEGQKTGAFLDQRENYAAAAKYAHGEALDVFLLPGWLRASCCTSVLPSHRRKTATSCVRGGRGQCAPQLSRSRVGMDRS